MRPWSASDTSTVSSIRRWFAVGSRRVMSRYVSSVSVSFPITSPGRSRPATLIRSGAEPPIQVRAQSRGRRVEVDLGRGAVGRELVLGEAARGCVRKLGHHLDVARHLESRKMLTGEPVQRGHVDRPSRRGDDERLHVFLRQLGRDADDCGFGDVGMAFERGLDLGRREVLAAPPDHFLLAADERERAVVVLAHEVARAQPSVDEHRRRLLGHLVVAAHHRGVAQLELADGSGLDRAVLVDDARVVDVAEVGMLAGRAERAERARPSRPDEAVRRLRHRVAAHDLEAEARSRSRAGVPVRATDRCSRGGAGCRRRRRAPVGA